MKLRKFKNQKWFSYTIATCSAVVLYLVLSNLGYFFGILYGAWRIVRPVVYGIIIAYLMNPICKIFERRILYSLKREANDNDMRMAHILGVICGVLSVLLFIIILLVALIPQLIESVVSLVTNAGEYQRGLNVWLNDIARFADARGLDINGFVQSCMDTLTDMFNRIPEQLETILATSYNVGVGIFNLIIAFVLAVYFLMAKESLMEGLGKFFMAILPPKRYEVTAAFWDECNRILIRYITFDIVDGLIVGIINFIYMLIVRAPYAVLISVIVGVANLAPTFGPIVGGAVGAIILVFVDPIYALSFLVFTLILQFFDGYILKPRLFGQSLGVPAVWILVTIIVGGNIFGVVGILLAIPFAAIVTYVYHSFIESKLDERVEISQSSREKNRAGENDEK